MISTEFEACAAESCVTPPPTGLALSEQALCLAPSKRVRHESFTPPSPPQKAVEHVHADTSTQPLASRFASRVTRSAGR